MQRKELKKLIDFLQDKKSKLVEELKSIEMVISGLMNDLDKLPISYENIAANIINDEYDKEWSVSKKVIFIINYKNRFLHFREIAEVVIELEKIDKDKVKDVSARLSIGCQHIKTAREIVKYQYGINNNSTFWGFPQWLDNNGKPLPEYDVNMNFVNASGFIIK